MNKVIFNQFMENFKTASIGLDIGATKIASVLITDKIIYQETIITIKNSKKNLLLSLSKLINELLLQAKKTGLTVTKIGLGVAGTIDYKNQKILNSPNLPILDNCQLIKELKKNFKNNNFDFTLDNDAKCFTRAEGTFGAGKKYNNFFALTIGTGIGGAWWLDNAIYRGYHNGAGEPGALVIDANKKITLEQAYQKLVKYNSKIISSQVKQGDILAKKIYQEFGADLGLSLANIVNLLDPQAIIIGGSVAKSAELFLTETEKKLKQYTASTKSKNIKIIISTLGDYAGAIGATL